MRSSADENGRRSWSFTAVILGALWAAACGSGGPALPSGPDAEAAVAPADASIGLDARSPPGPDANELPLPDAGEPPRPDAGEQPGPDAATPPDAAVTHEGFELATPESVGIDRAALDVMVENAKASETDALIIIKEGKLAFEWYQHGHEADPFIAMSASKSITSLAVGMAIAEGKMTFGLKMADLFAPWAGQAGYSDITVRHLLTQTSGIDAESRAMTSLGYLLSMRDYLATVALNYSPGASWRYSNAGVDALALFVELATGTNMETYLNQKLFEPVTGRSTQWYKSADGVPFGAGELLIRPIDLAKIGQLLLDKGQWRGSQILPADYLEQMQQSSSDFAPEYGLLWWRDAKVTKVALTAEILDEYASYGVDPALLAKLEPLVGTPYDTPTALFLAERNLLTRAGFSSLAAVVDQHLHANYYRVVELDPSLGYFANGWMGQYLLVDDLHKMAVVRMHYPTDADYQDYSQRYFVEYPGFRDDVHRLVAQ